MKKLYIAVPLILTVLLGFAYQNHTRQAAVVAAEKAAVAEQLAAAEQAKKAEAERQAREDADRRAAERIAEEKRKEDEKSAKWAAVGAQIAADTETYRAQAARHADEIKARQERLAALRADLEKTRQANLDLDLAVEAARVQKRNAELEIQRLVEMVARKGGTTLGATVLAP